MKKKYLVSFITAMAALSIAASANALLMNGGFEDGDNYWTHDGYTFFSPFPVTLMPTEGGKYVQISNGFPGPGGSDELGTPTAADIESVLGVTGLTLFGATEGSYIYQDFYAYEGSTISFDYLFLTNEDAPDPVYNDFSFVSLGLLGAFTPIASTYSSLTSPSGIGGYDYGTGVQSFSIVSPYTGVVRLGFAVVDVGDTEGESALYLDNVQVKPVPEPTTMLLIGAGIAGLASVRRRRKE